MISPSEICNVYDLSVGDKPFMTVSPLWHAASVEVIVKVFKVVEIEVFKVVEIEIAVVTVIAVITGIGARFILALEDARRGKNANDDAGDQEYREDDYQRFFAAAALAAVRTGLLAVGLLILRLLRRLLAVGLLILRLLHVRLLRRLLILRLRILRLCRLLYRRLRVGGRRVQ